MLSRVFRGEGEPERRCSSGDRTYEISIGRLKNVRVCPGFAVDVIRCAARGVVAVGREVAENADSLSYIILSRHSGHRQRQPPRRRNAFIIVKDEKLKIKRLSEKCRLLLKRRIILRAGVGKRFFKRRYDSCNYFSGHGVITSVQFIPRSRVSQTSASFSSLSGMRTGVSSLPSAVSAFGECIDIQSCPFPSVNIIP